MNELKCRKFLNQIFVQAYTNESFFHLLQKIGVSFSNWPSAPHFALAKRFYNIATTKSYQAALIEVEVETNDNSFAERITETEIKLYYNDYLNYLLALELQKNISQNPEKAKSLCSDFLKEKTSIAKYFNLQDEIHNFIVNFEDKIKNNSTQVVIKKFKELSRIIGGFNAGRVTIFTAHSGFGKCLAKGTKVLMYDGSLKAVEDLSVTDKLMGVDSTPRVVTSLGRGFSQLYKIMLNNGDEFTCNDDHILSLRNGKTKQIENYSIHEYLSLGYTKKCLLKAWKVGVEFQDQETNLDPYFMGLWLGDGTYVKPEITTPEPEIKKFITEYAEELGLVVRVYKGKGCEQLNITKGHQGGLNKKTIIQKEIENFKKDNQKTIAKNYLINSREKRLQLLAGLVDTDGYVNLNCIEIATKYDYLKEDILYLCRSLGFRVKSKIKTVNGSSYHIISISGDTDVIPTKVKRKKPTKRKHTKNSGSYGFKIEPVGCGEYYGFEISGDRLFILEDFTVTHNTNLGINLLIAAMEDSYNCLYVNMEMMSDDMVKRLLQASCGISSSDFNNGNYIKTVTQKMSNFDNASKNYFTDGSQLSLAQISQMVSEIKRKQDLNFVIVDYDQKILMGDYGIDQEWMYIKKAVEVLEEIAKREAVHVILFAQTNEDANGAPIASKRSIQPASAVMHFTRENGETIIKFNKNRFGPTNKKIKFIYDAAKSLIVEDGIIEPSPLPPPSNSPFKRPF